MCRAHRQLSARRRWPAERRCRLSRGYATGRLSTMIGGSPTTLLFRNRYSCVVEIGVQEAAARLGVSDRRVRALIDSERLAARRAGGRWLIDEAGLSGGVVASRPMSPRMAWAFIVALSGV